jgi:internalin A
MDGLRGADPNRVREAGQRIQVAAATDATTLDLSWLSLFELPESVCQLNQLRELDISGNQLTVLPRLLGELRHLQILRVAGQSLGTLNNERLWGPNRLKTLPTSLSRLTQLRKLDVSLQQLCELPEWLDHLTELQSLILDANELKVLPESLCKLDKLEKLQINYNSLTGLPESFGQLRSLVTFIASENSLSILPDSFGHLTHLRQLGLAPNRLQSLPDSFENLSTLEELNLEGNQFTALPLPLRRLRKLRYLKAGNNKLRELPSWISDLEGLERLHLDSNCLAHLPRSIERLRSLNGLFLHNNDDLGLPNEILGPTWNEVGQRNLKRGNPSDILDYYFRIRRGRRPLNEAKLILVGRGGAGKTCLMKRLIHDTFDEHEQETPGINVEPWEITLPLTPALSQPVREGAAPAGEGFASTENVRLHVWDFGGQRILHGTHQFFLTERTLYLLVLTGREDSATQDAEYWLQLIKSFGGDSRVIIALNKSRQHPFDVNRGLLLEKYPFIVDFVKTDCKDPSLGLSELRKLIHTQILGTSIRRSVATWVKMTRRRTAIWRSSYTSSASP